MVFYCIIGIHLFSGLTESRCRKTPEPVDGKWEADLEIKKLCGIWDCPEGLTCGNPADYHIERDEHESDFEQFAF
jgi:hypothetical protein